MHPLELVLILRDGLAHHYQLCPHRSFLLVSAFGELVPVRRLLSEMARRHHRRRCLRLLQLQGARDTRKENCRDNFLLMAIAAAIGEGLPPRSRIGRASGKCMVRRTLRVWHPVSTHENGLASA